MGMDHSRICFLCLRNTEPDLNCGLSNTSSSSVTQSFSISNITRFLEIDVGEILNVSEFHRQPGQLFKEDETDVKVSVCEDCSLMTERFNNLYQTLELTKIRISQCLERIYDLMLAAENDSNRLDTFPASSMSLATANGKEIFSKTCNYKEIMVNMKALRRATIDKCTRRLKNLPDNVRQVAEETFNDANVKMDVEVSEPFASSTIDDITTEEVLDTNANASQSLATALQHPIPMSSRNDIEMMDFDHLETTLKTKVSEPPASVEVIDLASDSGSLFEEPLSSSVNTDFENGLGDAISEKISSCRTTCLDDDCQCHLIFFRCGYCRVGNCFRNGSVLDQHMFSYHCETFFPTVKHFRYSENQFRMIIYHLLFEDLNIFFARKKEVFSCVYCKKRITGSSTNLKLHLLKYHHELVIKKLLEILEDPDLIAKLETVCWDKGTCEYCKTYHPNKITLDIHQKKYCPAFDNSMNLPKANVEGGNVHRRDTCKRIKRQAKLKKDNCVLPTSGLCSAPVSEQVATHNDLTVTSAKSDIQIVDDNMNTTFNPDVSDPLASVELIDLSSDSGSILEEPLNSNVNAEFENGLGNSEVSSTQTTCLDMQSDCHFRLFRCKYCRAGNCFGDRHLLDQHMLSYHCDTFFPTEKHFRFSKNQFRMIIYHLLFKELINIFFEKKLKGFWCVHCKKRVAGPSKTSDLRLHLLKCHHEQVVRKLLEIQEAPDLKVLCGKRWICEYCNTYYPSKLTLDIHKRRYCPAFNNSNAMSLRKAHIDCQRRQGGNKYTTCEKCSKIMTKASLFNHGRYCKWIKPQIKGNCVLPTTGVGGLPVDNDLAVASTSSTPNSSSKLLYLPPNTMVKCSACGKSQLISDFAKQKRCSCSEMSLDMLNVPNSETVDISSAGATLTSSSYNAMKEESLEVETIGISSEDLTLVSSSPISPQPDILTMGIEGNMASSCDDDDIFEVDPLG